MSHLRESFVAIIWLSLLDAEELAAETSNFPGVKTEEDRVWLLKRYKKMYQMLTRDHTDECYLSWHCECPSRQEHLPSPS